MRIVSDKKIGPAVLIEIEHGHAKRFGAGIENSTRRGDVFECAVASIVKEPAGFAAIRFGRAIGFVFSVEAAENVVLGRPVHIVADKKIEMSVTVIIKPKSGSAERLSPAKPALFRYILKRAFARIPKKTILPNAGYENVRKAIIVVVAYSDAHPVEFDIETGDSSDVGESSVAIIFVELERRTAAFMAGPIHRVHEQDVLVSVGIVVEKSTSRAERFWKKFSAVCAAVVTKIDSSLRRNIFQLEGWLDLSPRAHRPARQQSG